MGVNYRSIVLEIEPKYAVGYKFKHFKTNKEFEIVDYRVTHFAEHKRTELAYVVKSDNGVQQVTNFDGISELTIFKSQPV